MKILITGANGQLGRELSKQYSEKKGIDLILTDVSDLDITNVNKVRKQLMNIYYNLTQYDKW